MKFEGLYQQLRNLIDEDYGISIHDKQGYNCVAKVCVSPVNDSHPWVCFEAKTVTEALQDAIDKFTHPKKDYVDPISEHLWKANEESIYQESHIRLFLIDSLHSKDKEVE